jgi:hypothetical protein
LADEPLELVAAAAATLQPQAGGQTIQEHGALLDGQAVGRHLNEHELVTGGHGDAVCP